MKPIFLKALSTKIVLLSLLLLFFHSPSYAACKAGEISIHCGAAPTSVFDNNGRLWTTFINQQHVYISYSDDIGKQYSTPVIVNSSPHNIYSDGENRPKIFLNNQNDLFISWTEKTAGRFTGNIRFARSIDAGQHFEAVKTINDDGLAIGHRFDAMTVTPSGTIYIAWLDKRDSHAAKQRGQAFHGISIYYAVSTDQGKTFSSNIKIAQHTCECCRIAITNTGDDNATVMWRHIFNGGYRDHAIATLSRGKPSPIQRATVDQWKTDACPHHGPDLDSSLRGDAHLAWFSNGKLHKGLYYGRYSPSSHNTSNIIALDNSPHASHPQVKAFKNRVWFVWKSFENDQSVIKTRYSLDQGTEWSKATTIAATTGNSDHPLLIHNKDTLFISWQTTNEGLRLLPLTTSER